MVQQIMSRNATFQQWQALLGNRTKRHRAGEFIVQGVRPISLALEHDWDFTTLLRPVDARPTRWAEDVWRTAPGQRYELADELLAELAERDTEEPPELVALVRMPPDDLDRLASPKSTPLIVVFDRPSGPGNIGTLTRSLDAFDGTGLIVAGHAADPYDPRAVRASTGSTFAVPTVRVPAAADVIGWVGQQRESGTHYTVFGTDEGGETDLRKVDLTGPTVLVVGNETRGMSRAWREACDRLISIPMVGSASSLNAAVAGSVVLHEALQQRLP
ncbi:rRNA methyltransferase [Flexivirga endophytica]|uniref:rRNA methyltransferase n=1 Tax=Flexivirga endophytica TaxID=1849103 RepID=A0A916T718_9MICO|nr:TrmH family RNA methyltransferase [Flexivirga endophytica]GGB32387.1 rRNA methyltransferase [Flexivirga endophytica]GHB53268.1 rRNA methyltransferase [Flexivirga endophytica]